MAQIDDPDGYNAISDASTYEYTPHLGYQNARAYNHMV